MWLVCSVPSRFSFSTGPVDRQITPNFVLNIQLYCNSIILAICSRCFYFTDVKKIEIFSII